ncbi:choice-of-anchor I family protein [Shewanella waksmanii]|uniref:choice-of-anchor I family protein n=1 Tax=Shewanella waksmanii TaxID=213783 RepID=UPI0037361773
MKTTKTILSIIVASTLLTACDGDDGAAGANGIDGTNGVDGSNGLNSLVTVTELAVGSEQCAFGGQLIETGLDVNANDILDADEVDSSQTQAVCHGAAGQLSAQLIGRYESGVFGQSAAEIVDFHKASQHIFVINAQSGQVDIIDGRGLIADTVAPEQQYTLNNLAKVAQIDVATDLGLAHLGGVNSLAIYDDLLAVAIERGDGQGNSKQANGFVAFYQLDSQAQPSLVKSVEVGVLPDNVVFSHDGSKVIVANEGEPNDAYTLDPQGSVSVIAVTNGVPADVASSIGFSDFNQGQARHDELSDKIKINGPDATIAQDLEPEYIAVAQDNRQAYVSLQENNAIAVIDLEQLTVVSILPLGLKDFGLLENAIDASDKDDAINIQAYTGVFGMYQPDTIASYQWNGANFIVSANEGDARDYSGFSEEVRADDLILDPNHPQFAAAQDKTQLGRLKVTTSMGDTDGDGDYDQIVAYGGRSFSIWDTSGNLVFDSGNQITRITAAVLGKNFNNHNEESKGDSRSDDKGAEPEALAIGEIGGKHYAFVGLERTSGFMIFDISNPFAVQFIDYVVNRDFSVEFEIDGEDISGTPELAGDLGPEGMKFIAAKDSPTDSPLLVIGNEVSGTTAVYQLTL